MRGVHGVVRRPQLFLHNKNVWMMCFVMIWPYAICMRRHVEILPTIFESQPSDPHDVARQQSIKTSDFLAKLEAHAKEERVRLTMLKWRRLHYFQLFPELLSV